MSETIRKEDETTVNLTQGDTGRRWNSFIFQTDGQERAVMLSSDNSHMWHPICEFVHFHADKLPVCDGVERKLRKLGAQSRVMKNFTLLKCWLWRRREGTTVADGVTWSLGVAAVLMAYLKSNVHGGSTYRWIQGGGEYSPRWSLLELCRILLYKLGYSWTWFWTVCR